MKKDDTILIRISKEHKKQLKIRCLEKGFTLSEYILYCVMLEISHNEIYKIK